MMIKLKNGEEVVEIDSDFSVEEIDTLNKLEDDLDNTIEMPVIDCCDDYG